MFPYSLQVEQNLKQENICLDNVSKNKFLRLNEDRIKLKDNKPWYVGWAVCHADVANNLYSLYSRPSFINPDSTPPSKPWIFIGKYTPPIQTMDIHW